ncbi:extracellular solute-binding protein [Candidatus Poribacteria bacterium]|nr:extracellular solute-binding protein [Candidatus Poribacteria bacterium]
MAKYVICILLSSIILLISCSKKTDEVVVYVSEDQVFSEPILRDFEREIGIAVKAVYDTEEAKGTGVMNRLIAEKNNPQADVYWANEPIRAEILKQKGIAAPYSSPNAKDIPDALKDLEGYWTGFSARARVLIVNKRVLALPSSILAYTDPSWKGKAVITNPLFGTTTVEMAARFTVWGDERAKAFMADLKQNATKISTSNGESADLVASGEFDFSLVDSDDAVNRTRQGKPVEMVYPDQGRDQTGCLMLPNATLLIKGAPHPENARKLT